VDTLGLMHGLVVTPASIQDRDMIAPLMTVVRSMCATIQKSLADGGYQGAATATEVLALAGIPLEIVKRSDAAKGFVVLPKRWIWSARSAGSADVAVLPRTSRTMPGPTPHSSFSP